MDAPVGYYTQVLGLGATPSDVTFTGQKGVYSEEGDYSIGGALSSFWRSAENFRTSANNKWATGTGMMWAVSQAAPVRRIEVDNDLILFEYQPPIQAAGESSGGYMANVKVGAALRAGPAHNATLAAEAAELGTVAPGSQQQPMRPPTALEGRTACAQPPSVSGECSLACLDGAAACGAHVPYTCLPKSHGFRCFQLSRHRMPARASRPSTGRPSARPL